MSNTYSRSTTRSRREANKPNFVHYSKWIDVVADDEGNPKVVAHHKTKVLTPVERYMKQLRTKHGRAQLNGVGLS